MQSLKMHSTKNLETYIKGNIMTNKLKKLTKVNESITINRYDNGFMVEVGGRDDENDWKNAKILCNNEEEMLAVVREWNTMPIAD